MGCCQKRCLNVFHAYYYQVVQILKQSKWFTFYIQRLIQPWQKKQLRFTRVTDLFSWMDSVLTGMFLNENNVLILVFKRKFQPCKAQTWYFQVAQPPW